MKETMKDYKPILTKQEAENLQAQLLPGFMVLNQHNELLNIKESYVVCKNEEQQHYAVNLDCIECYKRPYPTFSHEQVKLTCADILSRLHEMIDKKFNRSNRGKYIAPKLLQKKMTLFALSGEFSDIEPEVMVIMLRNLLDRDAIVTNMDETYPLDAYFIPKTELMNEEHYAIYRHVKAKLA